MGRKLTTKEIKERIFKLVGDEYELLSEYVGANTKFRMRHETCNFEYMVSWNKFLQGRRCPKCGGRYRYTDNEISELIPEITNGEYTKQSTYTNSQTKFKIRHETCGNIYEVSWNSFQQGSRCPFCNQSKGEKFIEDYLTNHNISFATQVRFSDCKYKNPLPFDFGILDSEKKIVALIEFDGEQHFIPVKAWGGEENLKVVQLRDSIKNRYCQDNKIPLLRIRYDEDIEEKLSLFLYKLKAPKSQREIGGALSTN